MRKLIAEFQIRAAKARLGLRRFGRQKDGSVAIEYVILGPIYFLLLFGIFELAVISMSMTNVRVGLDDVSRLVRTGQAQCVSDDDVRDMVCDRAIGTNCASSFEIDRQVYSAGAGADAVSVDGWDDLNADDIILLDASYEWPLLNPLLDPFLGNNEGVVPIRAAAVFKSETFANVSCN